MAIQSVNTIVNTAGYLRGYNTDHIAVRSVLAGHCVPAEVVFDVVAFPPTTPLIALATELGPATISGGEIIALQAAKQFVLSTGIRPSDDQLRRAAAFSRAS